MHMSDALVSPVVGGTLWVAAAATVSFCSSRVQKNLDERKVPLMGVLGAFVFAVQMINFTIPATGSSGHLSGGLLLAILLGPSAAFLTIVSILMVQALFFADGGLLALGCNIINLGAFPAFIAYPLIFRKMVGHNPRQSRLFLATILAAVVSLQLGSLGVVLETFASGISALPFKTFLLLMQSIHLAVGIIEGVATALVVSFVYRARPEFLKSVLRNIPLGERPIRTLVATFLIAAGLIGGVLSWYASAYPDGLEWSITKITGSGERVDSGNREYKQLVAIRDKTVLFPGYTLPKISDHDEIDPVKERLSTSLAGLVGGAITLTLCLLVAFVLRRRLHDRHIKINR